jgi:hypothetical protein
VPSDGTKGIAPIFVLVFILGASIFARIELAMLTGSLTVKGSVGLVLLLVALRIVSLTRTRHAHIDFNEGPEGLHQLGLHT